jgi:rare lipoprotein A
MKLRSEVAVPSVPLWLAVFVAVSIAAPASGAMPPQTGFASVYSEKLNGKSTASGERYDSGALTAAHRTFPLGAEVRVTRLDNGKSVRVRVNDRGPHVRDRIIDLSSSAAAALGMRSGVARVKLELLSPARAAADAHPRP